MTEPARSPELDELDEFPAVVFDGEVFAVATSYAEFCRGIAEGEPHAIEIALADFSKERVALAGFFRTDQGESIDVMRQIQLASLGCPACGKSMSDEFTRTLAADQAANISRSSECEHCGSPRAYLLVVPDLVETTSELGIDPVAEIPVLLKQRREERRRSVQADYRKAQWGVTCHLARQVVQLALILIILAGALGTKTNLLMEYLEVFLVAGIVCRGLGVLGSYLCTFVPERSYSRAWAFSAMGLDALSIAVAAGSMIVLIRSPHLRVSSFWLEIGSMSLGLGAWVMFMSFLARLGRYMKFRRAGDRAAKLGPRGVWLVIVPIIVVPMIREASPESSLFTQLAALILVVGMMGWFLGACWFVYASISICATFRQLIGKAKP